MKNRTFPAFARAAEWVRRMRLERWTVAAVAVAFIAALAVVLATTQSGAFSLRDSPSQYQAGSVSAKDFVVERDFAYVDEKATEMKRDARERMVPPVYLLNDDVSVRALQTFDRFVQIFSRLSTQSLSEEKVLQKLQIDFPYPFPRADIRLLLGVPDLPHAFEEGRRLLEVAMSRGIADIRPHREEVLAAGAVEVMRAQAGGFQSEEVPLELALTVENLLTQMEDRAAEASRSDTERRIVLLLLRAFAKENAFFDPDTSLARRNRARADVEPVTEKLARGQVIARRGDVISESNAQKIRALSVYAKTVDMNGVAGSALFLLLAFALGLYLFGIRGNASPALRRGQVLLLLGLGLSTLAVSALTVRALQTLDWLVVFNLTSATSIVVAILVSTPAGVFYSLSVSLALLLLTGMGVQGFLFALLSGVAATAVVLNAERRINLILAGATLAFLDAAILAVLGLLSNFEPGRLLVLTASGLANGFLCGVLALGLLTIFEHALNVPTRFRLMELSDLNSPIFKRMLSLAPGTYTHSISVANLAETACEAIGANALLARVGAYYHDIGKVDQADYFIENQKAYNKHDAMSPSLSVAVIKSHVRIGIEKARELNLPQAIVDVIAQHHGRGLITYFYHRAVREAKNPRVSRDDYSYPGVRPKSKEAAVLMLADAIEAASRTLKKPTEARLERFVQDMVTEKLTVGELGDSNLTLRDLESIRRSFVHILEGYFHTRIEYPKLARSEGAKR